MLQASLDRGLAPGDLSFGRGVPSSTPHSSPFCSILFFFNVYEDSQMIVAYTPPFLASLPIGLSVSPRAWRPVAVLGLCHTSRFPPLNLTVFLVRAFYLLPQNPLTLRPLPRNGCTLLGRKLLFGDSCVPFTELLV